MGQNKRQWIPYDPQWLILLAQEQYPEELWLTQALSNCTRALNESQAYVYFVDSSHANKPGAEWQFERNILLDSPTEGMIVLDILTNQRVGGVEFIRKLRHG